MENVIYVKNLVSGCEMPYLMINVENVKMRISGKMCEYILDVFGNLYKSKKDNVNLICCDVKNVVFLDEGYDFIIILDFGDNLIYRQLNLKNLKTLKLVEIVQNVSSKMVKIFKGYHLDLYYIKDYSLYYVDIGSDSFVSTFVKLNVKNFLVDFYEYYNNEVNFNNDINFLLYIDVYDNLMIGKLLLAKSVKNAFSMIRRKENTPEFWIGVAYINQNDDLYYIMGLVPSDDGLAPGKNFKNVKISENVKKYHQNFNEYTYIHSYYSDCYEYILKKNGDLYGQDNTFELLDFDCSLLIDNNVSDVYSKNNDTLYTIVR